MSSVNAKARLWYRAEVPSNIALLKYWGKRDVGLQWPANDSLSLSLANFTTTTRCRIAADWQADHSLRLNGRDVTRHDAQGRKAFSHLDALAARFGWQKRRLELVSENNFPMGCGLASSASGLGALTLAALAAWCGAGSWEELTQADFDRTRVADLARQGSGSAGRSFWGGVVQWSAGERADAQELSQILPASHWSLADTVVMFSHSEKATSSSAAHQHAWSSPLFGPRLAILPQRLAAMRAALTERSMSQLGPLVEQEALEMHAVMMSAQPPTHYFGMETAEFLAWLRRWRQEQGVELYFTMDAGANVHVIGEAALHARLHAALAGQGDAAFTAHSGYLYSELSEEGAHVCCEEASL